MVDIQLKSFRADMMRAFPDVPALGILPILSEEHELRLMAAAAEVWSLSSVPKTHTVPFHIGLQKRFLQGVSLKSAVRRVTVELAKVFESKRIPALDGVDGDSGGSNSANNLPEFSGKTISDGDPYSVEIRYEAEISTSGTEIREYPLAGSIMQRFLEELQKQAPVKSHEEAYQRASIFIENVTINAGPIQVDASETQPELTKKQRRSWKVILGGIATAIAIALGAMDNASNLNDRYNPLLSATGQEAPEENESHSPMCDLKFRDGAPVEVVAINTPNGLLVLKEPVADTESIGSFMEGDQATLITQVGDFAKIRYWGKDGQISGWVLACHLERT